MRILTQLMLLFFLYSCEDNVSKKAKDPEIPSKNNGDAAPGKKKSAGAAEILAKPEVPILCYHQIRPYKESDSKTARDYIVPPDVFRQHMKLLADSGYQTILPDQLMDYLLYDKALPSRPIMITFDDTDLEQFTEGAPVLRQHGFKAVFFIMTVSIGRPRYMSKEQIKSLSDEGHVIGSHSWDHHNVKKYQKTDWVIQVEKPSLQLQEITGKPVDYFAYPFGLWNREAIPQLKVRGFRAAFQLSEKRDPGEPLYTIRRIIVPGSIDASRMYARIRTAFH